MFTVCPKCALTLVVTAADLKVAQGYVRCGRCSNVFNAIVALSEERHSEAAGLEGYVQPERPEQEKMEFDPVSTNVSEIFVEPQIGDQEPTGTFEAVVLETEPGATQPETAATPDPNEALNQELQSLADRIEAQNRRHPTPSAPAAPEFRALLEDAEQPHEPQPEWTWRAGIAALLVLLAIQAIHHYRSDLAANPRLSVPLMAIYKALGAPLVPRWNLAAYEVHQLGATTGGAGTNELIVRASLKNAAKRAQPLPLLRVSLQDRFGNRIAARDVAPEAYAPRMSPSHDVLTAGQRIDVELHFSDPGRNAVGFEIDACLPRPDGRIECAN